MCIISKRNSESKKNYPLPSPVSCFSYSNVEPRTVSDKDAVRFAVSASNSKTALSAEKNALGSITKSQSKNKNDKKKNAVNPQDNRRSAYALKNTSAKLLPNERVNNCLNNRVTADRGVDVKLSKVTGKAHYGNLMRCDSVWVCPCCSARILSQRGKEVEQGVNEWITAGGSVFMLTLTHSHKRDESLAIKMSLLKKALSRFFGDRAMKSVFSQFGKVGQIKALETTYSDANGWHPHHHILMFSKLSPAVFLNETVAVTFDKNGYVQYVDDKREEKLIARGRIDDIKHVTFEYFIKNYWVKICKAVGLGTPSIERGATIQDAGAVKTYLTKFKTAQELTNAQAKRAKNGSRNQWEILADAQNGCEKSGKLWQVYAGAFKGERQLFWSRGLKDLLLIEDVEDSEIEEFAEVAEEEIISICELKQDAWRYIVRKNWQPHVLDIVENDYRDETNNLEIFLYSIDELVKKEKAIYEQQERERIKNLVPPAWWLDHHEVA